MTKLDTWFEKQYYDYMMEAEKNMLEDEKTVDDNE